MPNAFECKISTAPPHTFKLGDPVLLEFEIKNISGDAYQVLKWGTPLEKEVTNFLVLKRGNDVIEYDGRLIKRGDPPLESYETIQPGQTLSETLDISTSYSIDQPGQYTAMLNAKLFDAFKIVGPAKQAPRKRQDHQPHELNNPSVTFTVVAGGEPRLTSGARARAAETLAKVNPRAPSFNGGTVNERDDVTVAHQNALDFVSLSSDQLQNTTASTNTVYQHWFGAFDQSRYDTVSKHYQDIGNTLLNDQITYDLTGTGCSTSYYAYTHKGGRTIWLCSQFWLAAQIGTDCMFGTIVHELSHAVCSTDDYVYGQTGAAKLATTDPGKAIKNADNHEYFAEELATSDFGKSCTFITDRSVFGADEIDAMLAKATPAVIDQAFYVFVDGEWPDRLGITAASLTGTPNVVPAITVTPSVPGMTVTVTALKAEDSSLPVSPQRFTWVYSISFANTSGFPTAPGGINVISLTATIAGLTGTAQIQLIREPNPYELDGEVSWLSTDLRVFQIGAGDSRFGVTMGQGPGDAPTFIQQVLGNLNSASTGGETFDDISVDEQTSKLELASKVSGKNIFNYAIARVRYRGTVDIANVRVFFRLFPAATTSTDYDANTTYRRGTQGGTTIPLLGMSASGDLLTIPCFAEARVDSSVTPLTGQSDSTNVKNITHNASGDEVATYFGCWLDINQTQQQFPLQPSPADGPWTSGRRTIQQLIRNAHQCLVAEIAFDPDPIPTGSTPASSDKLAQRNLAIVESANPGEVASHRIPQTFEIRPTPSTLQPNEMPDELMIDWGDVPAGSEASIYLPGTSAATVLALADSWYARHGLWPVDAQTVGCKASGITYMPIPPGVGSNFAGLLTIDLPATVTKGQAFKVITRQITNTFVMPGPSIVAAPRKEAKEGTIKWRRVVGTFQLTIPVSTKEALLKPALRQLAVLKYIQQSIPANNWWSPVFGRYVQGLADRVGALGGHPDAVLPSPAGDAQNGQPLGKDVPYVGTWLVLGPIFDPTHQPGSHIGDVTRPRAGQIIMDIDNHKDQLDPLVVTTLQGAPSHGDLVHYGGRGADGNTVLAERAYTWRKRYFGGLEWSNLNDIKDDVHTHLGGDYDDDPFDAYNYLNFAGKQHALALFLVYIITPDDRTTRIALRHDDAVRVWLNGEEITNDALPFLDDHAIIDEDETLAEIKLQSGTNILLVAVAETHGEWGVSARIENDNGLLITADKPQQDPIALCESRYRFVGIASIGNYWNPYDADRALVCEGKGIWRGRVRMADEQFKIVGNKGPFPFTYDWWGRAGHNLGPWDNFPGVAPGIYDVIFNEQDATHPVFILVKPFA